MIKEKVITLTQTFVLRSEPDIFLVTDPRALPVFLLTVGTNTQEIVHTNSISVMIVLTITVRTNTDGTSEAYSYLDFQ